MKNQYQNTNGVKSTLLAIAIILFGSGCNMQSKSDAVLVFSKTEGFVHESIPAGIQMIKELGEEKGFKVETSVDSEIFTERKLKEFKAVVFLNTTGDILNDKQQAEFQRFIQAGGGFLGIHAAADTEYKWPWYGKLVGGYFNGHPNNPNVRDATVSRVNKDHLSTSHLPDVWPRTDEWYNYKNLNPNMTILLNLDENSYEGGTNGDSHPIAWCHEFDGGRSFYSGGGHTDESYADPSFRKHILGAIEWISGDGTPVNYNSPTVMPAENRFQAQVLGSYFKEPMELDLMPDGRIVFIERKGKFKIYDPETEKISTIDELEVFEDLEDGLLGFAIDPDYSNNKHIYVCYSPLKESQQNVSRFTFDPDADEVLTDEKIILSVPTQRETCCHSAGSVEFGPEGNLWVSFGDNTNPFESDGMAPIDERKGRSPWDARKSSSNANDLRGGIIRISVKPDGSYDIPDGNLFPKDGSKGKPEIYVMGCRNPFRFSIDPKTKYVYWGDVGPDGRDDNPTRGARGHDEVNQAKGPGYFGWPLFIGDNKPYNAYSFTKKEAGEKFNPLKPINDSPNNTGVKELPPAQPAMIYYPYAESDEFPNVGTGGRNAMAGPIYYQDLYPESDTKYPTYYDGKLITYDWMRGWMMAVTFDENGDYESMERFLPSSEWNNLMDVVMSPNGDMYLLEYGRGWYTANKDARLMHLKYTGGNRSPVAKLKSDIIAGAIPLNVNFDGLASEDFDGDNLKYAWDFGDGSTGGGENTNHTYSTNGEYQAKLTVTDQDGLSSTQSLKIFAGNTPPQIDIAVIGNSQFYFPGAPISYKVTGSDNEDGILKDEDLTVTLDYLERGYDLTQIAQGHQQQAELIIEHPGSTLIKETDCVSCHRVDGPSVGPSYVSVQEKYGKTRDAIGYLADKVIKGGGGVWGETAMAAHPNLPESDANTMAEYIMSLGDDKEVKKLATHGNEFLSIPEGRGDGGSFILQASYTDNGGENVSTLSTKRSVILRSPILTPKDASSMEEASAMTVSPEMSPLIKEEMEILIVNKGAHVVYENIDLTGVGSIMIMASAPSMFAGGGSISLSIDDGDAIATHQISSSSDMSKLTPLMFPINESGKHSIVIKADSDKAQPIGTIMTIMLQSKVVQ